MVDHRRSSPESISQINAPLQIALQDLLTEHLAWWGLRHFDSDPAYFRWQRETLSSQDITHLNHLVEQKRRSEGKTAEDLAFYDFSARAHILPVLYSQRYDYYRAVGPLVAERIEGSGSVMDFGCGPGILTTFYARCFPDIAFVGVDRSPVSIHAAHKQASALGLTNVRFERFDAECSVFAEQYDLIVSTHALLQSEIDPGLPSANWQTFFRPDDPCLQTDFERRTGLSARLDALRRALMPHGRLLVFEKARQPARRVPFQRALAARGFRLLEPPLVLRYRLVEDVADDGPLYVLTRDATLGGNGMVVPWDETPEYEDGEDLYRCGGKEGTCIWERLPDRTTTRVEVWDIPQYGSIRAERGVAAGSLAYLYLTTSNRVCGLLVGGQTAIENADRQTSAVLAVLHSASPSSSPDLAHLPLYENHTPSAQSIWSRLPDRKILQTTTLEGSGGRQMHVELGESPGLIYLYWANTFDQRQVVIVERSRAPMLEQYYQEFLDGR